VNEVADELVEVVATKKWNTSIEDNNSSGLVYANISMSLFVDPFSFTLIGVRLKKKDLILQLLGISLTSLIALCKSLYINLY
jgi:hypothetical protein